MSKAIKDASSPDPKVRMRAIDTLCANPVEGTLHILLTCLKDSKIEIRSSAAMAIGFMELTGAAAAKAVSPLCDALTDKAVAVRINAGTALRSLGRYAKPALPALVSALADKNSDVRSNAVFAVAELGPSAKEAPHLIPLLGDKSKYARCGAQRALMAVGPAARKAVPFLEENLIYRNEMVRVTAAMAIWSISGPTESCHQILEKGLESTDARIRQEVVVFLGKAKRHRWVVELLQKATSDEDAVIQVIAAEGLLKHRQPAATVLPILVQALRSDDEIGRRLAAQALERMGKDARDAVPNLKKALRDEDVDVRAAAKLAIALIGG